MELKNRSSLFRIMRKSVSFALYFSIRLSLGSAKCPPRERWPIIRSCVLFRQLSSLMNLDFSLVSFLSSAPKSKMRYIGIVTDFPILLLNEIPREAISNLHYSMYMNRNFLANKWHLMWIWSSY